MIRMLESNPPNLEPIQSCDRFFFLTEVDVGFGRVDFVFYNINEKTVRDRKIAGLTQPLLVESLINVLLSFSEEIATIKELSTRSLKSRSYLNYLLNFLAKYGYVTREDSHTVRKNSAFRAVNEYVVAVEAKINDWKRGLSQATRYRWFANEAYLAISKEFAHRAISNLELFKKFNVGLISLSPDENDIVYRPLASNPYSTSRNILSGEIALAKILSKE